MQLEDIKTIGLAGGKSGSGIALNFAVWGYPTIVYGLDDEILKDTGEEIRKGLRLFVEEGLITPKWSDEAYNRISFTLDISKLANADFITEALGEGLSQKQMLFTKLDSICNPQAIFASSRAEFLIDDIGKDVKRQDKIVTTHYYNPPHLIPGIEIQKGQKTSGETINVTYDLMRKVKKAPIKILKILTKPSSILQTIQHSLDPVAQRLWAEGYASAEDIDLGCRATWGFRYPTEGPMSHYDLFGAWKWPKEERERLARQITDHNPDLKENEKEKIENHYGSGKPFFIKPDYIEQAVEAKNHEYARRLKELYWGKLD